jgi:hypothetical protein
MNYYSSTQLITITGDYIGFMQGGYAFHLENDDIIDFDQINPIVLEEFDLKSSELKNKTFEIVYSENFEDLDDEDVVIFKLEKLKSI